MLAKNNPDLLSIDTMVFDLSNVSARPPTKRRKIKGRAEDGLYPILFLNVCSANLRSSSIETLVGSMQSRRRTLSSVNFPGEVVSYSNSNHEHSQGSQKGCVDCTVDAFSSSKAPPGRYFDVPGVYGGERSREAKNRTE